MILIIVGILSILMLSNAQLEEWKIPCGSPYLPKNCENASLETLETIEDYERCAPAMLEPTIRSHIWGAAGNEKTFYENKEAYKRIWIKGRRLQGFSNYTLETFVFGRRIGFPVGISPTSLQSFCHPDGEQGMSKGAASMGTVMIMGVLSFTSLEDVAAAVSKDAELWMQTFIFKNRQLTADVVHRAEKAGFKAIVVTTDQLYRTDIRCNARAAFKIKYKEDHSLNPNLIGLRPDDSYYDMFNSFKDITWIAGITKLPIVVKGILTAEDAIAAIEAGASAVFVSNQGGRVLDDAMPTIDALPAIVRAVRAKFPSTPVFVDGGIRSGHDVFKALARGADMAFIGRPALWGLTVGGEKGVAKVLSILKEGFKDALLHAGFACPCEINASSIVSQWIYNDFSSNTTFIT